MKDLTYRADLAQMPHTITVEPLTLELRRDSDLPTHATLVVIERHHGRLAKVCSSTDAEIADYVSWGYKVTIEDVARGIAGTYGATYIAAPSTVVRTVAARNGLVGYQVHALRVGAPLPGGQHIADVTDYGSDTHLAVTDTAGCERYISRHAEIRELETGVVQLITPEHAGWASD